MSLPEAILNEVESMNDFQKQEVLDFARYLKQKEEQKFKALVEDIITENKEALEELAK